MMTIIQMKICSWIKIIFPLRYSTHIISHISLIFFFYTARLMKMYGYFWCAIEYEVEYKNKLCTKREKKKKQKENGRNGEKKRKCKEKIRSW